MKIKKLLLLSMLTILVAITSVSAMADQKKFKKLVKPFTGSTLASKKCPPPGELKGGTTCIYHIYDPDAICPAPYATTDKTDKSVKCTAKPEEDNGGVEPGSGGGTSTTPGIQAQ